MSTRRSIWGWASTILIGAASALREAIGTPLPPIDRPVMDRTLTVLRAALDDDAFNRLYAHGAALSVDEAVEYALRIVEA
jgi:hypothetical protein